MDDRALTFSYFSRDNGARLKPENLIIVVGMHDLTKIQPKDEYTVDRIIVHENYKIGKKNEPINDITLLHIPKAIDFSSGLVNSVCLPAPGERFVKNLDVSGWGKTLESGVGSDVLQTVQVFVHGDAECSKGNLKDVFRPHEMFCAGVRKGGKDSCEV
ncbi:trypsin-like protein [Leptotrombidium deliense]|uniref:Trypsin-like protein n=1 Tax=Leptotrombidium deliense TaxID=299467 RepID=A0A443S1F9_9ACAR|nr:trypsin-like protein [Leptotrombidium deliense]